ncbi:MAG TPA: tetratricopeptide repeat protein [Blastocatellia bacterium]|nr:tetratricopeptide repeat protein [Blastocatellia bacterium]
MFRPYKSRALRFVAAAILLCATQPLAPAQSVETARQNADRLFQAKKWPEAALAYEEIVKAAPDDGRAWYQLAMVRYSLGRLGPAADAFRASIRITGSPGAMFNLACVYARLNENDKAVEWLGKAFAPENKAIYLLDLNDPDLNSLHGDPRYKEIWLAADKRKNPCMYSAEARRFDFWVGEWDVFNPQGRKDGTSVIQRFAGGCGILENWTSVGAGGKSINFYDPHAGKWFQYWIGADGNPARYSGLYKDGAIRYEGEPYTQNGKQVLSRLTFFNVDARTVRQLAEQSTDGGNTWTVTYDYKYVRREPANSVPGPGGE